MSSIIRGVLLAAAAAAAVQNPDQQAEKALLDGSAEVIRTASTAANRYETGHLILYIDKGLLSDADARGFSTNLERHFVATSQYLRRRFEPGTRKVPKPSYYLTDRAGLSHAGSVRVFLRAQRVIPAPAIAIHESVHLLLMRNPDAPRNRTDLTPEADARLMQQTGVWLAEGFATYASAELAPRLGIEPERLFVKGDRTTIDAEARQWIRDPRGGHVLPFVASHGYPEGLLADRANVAAPFYVLGCSFAKYLVEHSSLEAIVRVYEQHFDGTRSIEEDVRRITGRDLAAWRQEWLRSLGE